MHRLTATLLAALALGVAINILVAWTCALTIDVFARTGSAPIIGPQQCLQALVINDRTGNGRVYNRTSRVLVLPFARIQLPGDGGAAFIESYPADGTVVYQGDAVMHIDVPDEREAAPPFSGMIDAGAFISGLEQRQGTAFHNSRFFDARGWPMLSLWCEVTYVPPRGKTGVMGGFNSGLKPWAADGVRRFPRALPLRPLWRGFIFNSALYALLVAVLWRSPRALTRLMRKWKGACPTCGYDMRGHAQLVADGTVNAPRCPECGSGATE